MHARGGIAGLGVVTKSGHVLFERSFPPLPPDASVARRAELADALRLCLPGSRDEEEQVALLTCVAARARLWFPKR